MTPYHLRVTRVPSLTGAIDAFEGGYTVTVSDGVRSTSWTGAASDVDAAVALMTRIFRDQLVVA